MPLDTLKIAKELEKEFTPAQAEAIIAAVKHTDVLGEELRLLAQDVKLVREDLRNMQTSLEARLSGEGIRLDAKIDRLDAKIETQGAGIRGEIERLDAKIETQGAAIRGEIKDAKLELIKWMIGALILNFVGSAGLMITLIRTVKPEQPRASGAICEASAPPIRQPRAGPARRRRRGADALG